MNQCHKPLQSYQTDPRRPVVNVRGIKLISDEATDWCHLRNRSSGKVRNFFFPSVISNQSIRYSMSWCAGCLSWRGPLQRDLFVVDSVTVDWVMAHRNWGFNLKSNFTNYPDHGHHGDPPPTRKNSHSRAGNRTQDLVVSSQKLWPPDHEAGRMISWPQN